MTYILDLTDFTIDCPDSHGPKRIKDFRTNVFGVAEVRYINDDGRLWVCQINNTSYLGVKIAAARRRDIDRRYYEAISADGLTDERAAYDRMDYGLGYGEGGM